MVSISSLLNLQGEFSQIVHLGGSELVKSWIRPDGLCDMVGPVPIPCYIMTFDILILSTRFKLAGVIYMSPKVAATMLSLHTSPPLDSCTYVGLDNGALPLSVSS